MHKSTEMIEIIATGLGKLLEKVVFIGGATTPLYIDDPAAPEIRPTEDVDCVIEITTRTNYYALEENLRKLGFKNVIFGQNEVPICRWKFHDVVVDIMPTEGKILGFTNRWYHEGIANAIQIKLPSKIKISIFTAPYFIASKLEAFYSRGKDDFRFSPDIEDIISILVGRSQLKEEILSAPNSVREYLKKQFEKLSNNENFQESLFVHIGSNSEAKKRIDRLMELMKSI